MALVRKGKYYIFDDTGEARLTETLDLGDGAKVIGPGTIHALGDGWAITDPVIRVGAAACVVDVEIIAHEGSPVGVEVTGDDATVTRVSTRNCFTGFFGKGTSSTPIKRINFTDCKAFFTNTPTSGTSQYGWKWDFCQDSVMTRCHAEGYWLDGTKLRALCERIYLIDCSMDNNGNVSNTGDGIDLFSGGTQARIVRGFYTNNGGAGINVKRGDASGGGTFSDGVSGMGEIENIYVTGAYCAGNQGSGVSLTRGTVNPGAWGTATAYSVNDTVVNGGLAYICRTAGTSAGSGGPTGRGRDISDNTVVWDYYGPPRRVFVTECLIESNGDENGNGYGIYGLVEEGHYKDNILKGNERHGILVYRNSIHTWMHDNQFAGNGTELTDGFDSVNIENGAVNVILDGGYTVTNLITAAAAIDDNSGGELTTQLAHVIDDEAEKG